MSNVTHTPSPWRVSSHVRTIDGREVECDPDSGMFDACIMATNSEGRLISIAGERGSKLNPYDYLPVAESAANMHLIAAAPDLLALLSEIDEALAEWKNLGYISYGSCLMPSRFDSQLERIELRIEEIIAAAKGETS